MPLFAWEYEEQQEPPQEQQSALAGTPWFTDSEVQAGEEEPARRRRGNVLILVSVLLIAGLPVLIPLMSNPAIAVGVLGVMACIMWGLLGRFLSTARKNFTESAPENRGSNFSALGKILLLCGLGFAGVLAWFLGTSSIVL